MEKIQKRKNRARVLWADRAQRKTMALKVSEDGTVTVRIPYGVRPEEADRFVEAHVDWIRKRIAECRERAAARPAYTDREREAGKRLAKELLFEEMPVFCRAHGRFLRDGHRAGAEDPVGQLQRQGKLEF